MSKKLGLDYEKLPPVYTVVEVGPDFRRHFMGGVCLGAATVDYCINQGLDWYKIPRETPLKRRGHFDKVIVTPDMDALPEWKGNMPQWEITEHKRMFHLAGDDEGVDPMRTDPGWPRK